MEQGLTALLWLLAIAVMIPGVLWLLKRTPMGGAATGSGLRAVASLPLSASQRVVTVEVGHGEGRRWLVLGVSPQGITTLHTLEPQGDAPATPAAAPGFAQMLSRLRGGREGGDGA